MTKRDPIIVTVIIPTFNRPGLVCRAVKSALSQSFRCLEVIVVVDGPDQTTVKHLADIDDSRLKVIVLPENGGPANARNVAIQNAQGEWVAFLDDDDEWLPQKLERQLEVAGQSDFKLPIISCQFIALTSKGNFVWPRRLPALDEPVGEYLFARRTLFRGETYILTSTLLVRRELLERMAFSSKLYTHEDLDWLIRASQFEGVGIEFVDEPLLLMEADIRHSRAQEKRDSLSNATDWQYSLDWIRSVHHLVTPSAYSGFIMSWVSPQAAAVRDWGLFWRLMNEAIQLGQPRPIDYLIYLAIWLVPENLRHQLRSMKHALSKGSTFA